MQKKGDIRFFFILFVLLLAAAPLKASAGPELVGEAAVLLNVKNGQVLYEKNSRSGVYPASTTKILTAVIALEKGNLNDLVSITPEASNVEGSAIGLQAGEKVSLEDLLYALMLNSGNDSAVAIARHVGGTVENFVAMMNDKAAGLGALNTHFSNPNGLPDPGHYTTAYDMAIITRYAMQNPEFRKMVSTKVKIIHRDDADAQTYLENHNRLLWNYEGAIGVKTGYTEEARQCLVSAANRQGRELIAVVMKSEGADIWEDTKKLLDYGFGEFYCLSLTEAGKHVDEVPVKFGVTRSVPVQTGNSLFYDFPLGQRPEVKQEAIFRDNLAAPVRAGEKMGELVFSAAGRELGRVDLLAQREVKRKLTAQWWPWFLLAVFLAVLLSIVRYHNRARRAKWETYRNRYYYLK
ncbi:MAG TPA: D-alanyl-D-alanine carboxypeptidase family protein [Bacillota bacterium]|nr:D-alanyl-D-alanine carboxypeptidase family protein [Bacillota bacterium]